MVLVRMQYTGSNNVRNKKCLPTLLVSGLELTRIFGSKIFSLFAYFRTIIFIKNQLKIAYKNDSHMGNPVLSSIVEYLRLSKYLRCHLQYHDHLIMIFILDKLQLKKLLRTIFYSYRQCNYYEFNGVQKSCTKVIYVTIIRRINHI